MLPAVHRLRRSSDFRLVARRGRRVSSPTVLLHAIVGPAGEPALVGFVVSKGVGTAVVRNLVKRRLRHAAAGDVPALAGWQLVVRAKPEAADASFAQLAADLRRSWTKVVSQQ